MCTKRHKTWRERLTRASKLPLFHLYPPPPPPPVVAGGNCAETDWDRCQVSFLFGFRASCVRRTQVPRMRRNILGPFCNARLCRVWPMGAHRVHFVWLAKRHLTRLGACLLLPVTVWLLIFKLRRSYHALVLPECIPTNHPAVSGISYPGNL